MLTRGINRLYFFNSNKKTCLKFPFLLDVYVFDNVQQGFDRILSNFNGIKELYLRNDAATVLLSYYKKNKSEYLGKPYLIEKKYETDHV